jgi:hypothetical protein
MKWILSRNKFLNEEAKLRDILLKPQQKVVKEIWGEKYLDYEEVTPTERIKQGRWKLSDEDRDKVINEFFGTDYSWVRNQLNSLPERFANVLKQSLFIKDNRSLPREQLDRVKEGFLGEFNIKELKIIQISCLSYPIFKGLNVSETKADSRIVRDESGRPVKDKEDKIVKEPKVAGEPSFSTNGTNLNSFITGYNSCYPDEKVDPSIFQSSNFQNISNMINDNPDIIDFDLFGEHEMYLMIEHNAVHIMNMSVSKFYKSCQEMYFGGGHGGQYMRGLLVNVFDPNTVPAFLVFNTPYYSKTEDRGKPEKLSDVLPLCRLLIRSIEPFNEESKTKLYFDKTYPDRMNTILWKMITSYSGNVPTDEYLRTYPFAPDIDIADVYVYDEDEDENTGLPDPYMDHLSVVKGTRIGKNTKSLYLSNNIDWSNTIIDKDAQVKELIIETTKVPENFFKIKIKPEWVKFKYLKINDFSVFSNIITDSVSLYQCKLNVDFLDDLHKLSPELKKLALCNVEVGDFSKISNFKSLEELELIYTISSKENLKKILSGLNVKSLVLSGDLAKNRMNKEYINKLKKSGVKVTLKGLVL